MNTTAKHIIAPYSTSSKMEHEKECQSISFKTKLPGYLSLK
jgi:hypothetical protein